MDDIRTEEYLRLLAKHERNIAAYVHSLVPLKSDADEILQDAKVVMWKKFESFESGTNFAAWGKKIALGLTLNYRRSNKRRRTVPGEATFIEAVAAEMERLESVDDVRTDALESCLQKLPAPHRQMVLWRYFDDLEISALAEKTSQTEAAVYRMLSRIRKTLEICIETELSEGAGA